MTGQAVERPAAREFLLSPTQTVVGEMREYVVQPGEDLNEIARKFDLGYTALARQILESISLRPELGAYGPSIEGFYRQAARLIVKIFGGAKPADLPVEQPSRIALVVNLQTAKALGITVPQAILARADEVIE
jgi:ABC transporter substrate binding protein